MAINSNAPRQEFTASAGQTDFDFNFKIFQPTDIVAYLTPSGTVADDETSLLTYVTDYDITIDGDDGGTLALTSGATVDDSVVITRVLDYTRTVDYQSGGDLLEATLDEDQNYQTYLTQQLSVREERHIKMPDSVAGISAELLAPASDGYIKWNEDATGLENDTTVPDEVEAEEKARD